jgi:flagellar hook-associated protein 3 FlgL
MIRRLDAGTETFLTDLSEVSRRVARVQREITSGRRINEVSDAPAELSNLFQLRTELAQAEQIRSNLGRVSTEVDAAEHALQAAVKTLERASVLGMQGANGTMTPERRNMIAAEVETLLEQMTGLARSRIEARHIFSGNADDQPPFTLDLTLDDPVSDYLGDEPTRLTMHPAGTTFSYARSGEEIFDNLDPDKNAFQAINSLRLALRNNDDAAISAALDQLTSAEAHMNEQLAAYGAVQNHVAEAIDFTHKLELRLNTRLSEVEDTDLTSAILELNEARYQQEVALSTKARVPKTSLFDYLG